MKRALVLSTILACGIAFGQAPTPNPTQSNPTLTEDNESTADTPNRAVARISVINGVVSVRRGDSGEAVAAAMNAPLTGTDRLLTGEGSRAEIQFDAANMIRLAPMTEVRIGELAYHRYQIQIATGTTTFRILRDNEAEIEISTPSVSIRPLKHGIYRITVKADGTSEITVRSGEVEVSTPKGTEKLGSGKTMEARGTANDPEFQTVGAIAADQWDKWNADRDHDLENSPSGRYVNPDINGTEELDANGRWVNDPSYGQVWVPAVDPGWAPYRVGRWVWVDYYGWTWVSGDPWGWAPYHYGRWYQSSYGWAWWPGAVYGPYYWRPALVGFFGWGGGFGVGFGFGNVGWVALAPYERFHPWYGAGYYGRGFGNASIVHNTNVTNIYRNARVANGVTSMASNQFGRASVNSFTNIRANSADLAKAGAVRGAMPITPSRESTHFSDRAASTAAMPRSSDSSHFYSRGTSTASSTSHVSFDQQRQAMTRSASSAVSRPSAGGSSNGLVRGPGSSGSLSPSVGGGASASHTAAPSSQPSGSATSNAGGWQRFNGNNSGVASGNASAGRAPTAAGGSSANSGGSGSQAVRINPSVVQSRGSSTGPASTGGSSSSRSSSAPSRGSSGGGGGSRSSSSGSKGGGGRR